MTLLMMNTTTIKMDFYEAGWRCVLEEGMAQCVMTSGTIRMPLWSADSLDSLLMVSNELQAGRIVKCSSIVELFLCQTNPSSSTPCTSFLGAIGLTNEVFSEEVAPLLLTDVSCTGTESTLLNCTYNTRPQYLCGRFEDAGVVCQGVYSCDSLRSSHFL